MAARKTLTFVSGNPRKLEELLSIVGTNFPLEIVSRSVELPELQGEPEDVAKEKCIMATKQINGPLIIEDTCLCFNALKGLPGPYIKWFLQKLGHQAPDATGSHIQTSYHIHVPLTLICYQRPVLVLQFYLHQCGLSLSNDLIKNPELYTIGITGLNNLLAAYDDKSAYALCTIAYHSGDKNSDVVLFEGKTMGKIVPARGPNYFGWDPIFQPDGFEQTYAEMDKAVKNSISHRRKAINNMMDYFTSQKWHVSPTQMEDNKKSKLET